MQVSASELTTLVGAWLWPLFRVAGLVIAGPVTGTKSVPAQIRLMMTLAITLVIVPMLPPHPPVDLISFQSLFIIVQQVLIGILLGFTVQLVFSAVITGGQIIAMQMGLGFSVMVDPQNGGQAPVLSQFYVMMVILVYLALNGHLILIEVLVDSFRTLPIGADGLTMLSFRDVAYRGSQLFAGGLAIALPAVASLLVVNLSFGIMTRAAPQLNLFAIGFPVTMLLGFVLIFITLPSVIPQSTGLFTDVFHFIKQLMASVK